jgi:3'-5' exoribonuclease
MKTIYIKDLEKNQIITGETFAIYEVAKLEDKNGNPYSNLIIGDKTGRLEAKIWSDTLRGLGKDLIKSGNLISISGKVDEYRGKVQLTIMSADRVDETELDDFMERSMFDSNEMMKTLESEINLVNDPAIKKVLLNILNDKEVRRMFMYWPAAKSIHHDFRSGLLQHVLEMLEISKSLRKFYPELDYDVLIAGIILHDIGKVKELTGGLGTNYTKMGSLLGHIYIGTEIFDELGGKTLPENTALHIKHLILSHHGEIQFGSPVVPATPEAVALTYIDKLSSKTRTAVKAVNELGEEEEFSKYNPWLENARFWNKKVSDKMSSGSSRNLEDTQIDPESVVLEEEDHDNGQIPLV